MLKRIRIVLFAIVLVCMLTGTSYAVEWNSIIEGLQNENDQFTVENVNISVDGNKIYINGGQISNPQLRNYKTNNKTISAFDFSNTTLTGTIAISDGNVYAGWREQGILYSPVTVTFQESCIVNSNEFNIMQNNGSEGLEEYTIENYGEIHTGRFWMVSTSCPLSMINQGTIEASSILLQSTDGPVSLENDGDIKVQNSISFNIGDLCGNVSFSNKENGKIDFGAAIRVSLDSTLTNKEYIRQVRIINKGKMTFLNSKVLSARISSNTNYSFIFDNKDGNINENRINKDAVKFYLFGKKINQEDYQYYPLIEGIDKTLEQIYCPGFGIIGHAGSLFSSFGSEGSEYGDDWGDVLADIWIDELGKLHRRSVISFDSNGGSGTIEDIIVSTDTQYVLPENTFTAPAGMVFDHWQIDDKPYAVGDKITVNGITKVKAVWVALDDADTQINFDDLDDVPPELRIKFNNVNQLKMEIFRYLYGLNSIFQESNTVYFDVKLMVKLDGKNWVEATVENFPAEGIRVRFDFPKGTNSKDYDFKVAHMFTHGSPRLGTKAGQVETPDVLVKDDGIWVTLKGLSPIGIAWSEKTDIADLPKTGDNSNIFIYCALLTIALFLWKCLAIGKKKTI